MSSCRIGRNDFSRCTRFTGAASRRSSKNSLSAASCGRFFSTTRCAPARFDEDEIRRLDPEGLSFLNMNSPADYDAALQLWRQEHSNSISVSVELFGVARLLAKTQKVSSRSAAGSDSRPCLFSPRGKIAGSGRPRHRLRWSGSGYTCNINGLDFVRAPSTKINSGDKIFILSADAGGEHVRISRPPAPHRSEHG